MTIDSPSTVTTEATPSSPGEGVEASTVSQGTGDEGAESSSASGQTETHETLLDAVKKALPAKDGPDAEESEEGEGESSAPGAKEGQPTADDITQEELDSYRPRTKKRIEELLGQNRDLRGEVDTLRAQADTTVQLQEFLRQNDIAKEDFGLTLDLAAAMRKGDFRGFLEGVMPYVQLAQEQLGIVLPQDLAIAVQQGHMSMEAAQYTAQVRGNQAVTQAQAERLQVQRDTEAAAIQAKAFTTSVETAVSTWEKGVRRKDPDYARKEPVIQDMLHAVVQEYGPPDSPQKAVEIARLAYERANKVLASFAPPRSATRMTPSSLNRVNGARAEPNSLLEAAQQALERGQ